MNRELALLRYGLIVIPALIAMHLQEYEDYGLFTLHMLILLLLVVLSERLPRAFPAFISCLEALFTAWLASRYGPLMIFPAISALSFYSRLQPRLVPFIFAAAHWIALNTAVKPGAPLTIALVNLTFLLSVCLTFMLNRARKEETNTLFLYDELRRRHFELDEARTRLQQFAVQVETVAGSEERVRIARQLHDDIGHRLIRVKMMMEAAIHMIPTAPEPGMALLEQIRDQLSASMDDMRSAVKRIHYSPQHEGAYALDQLLEETGRDTGILTSYTIDGVPFQLYPSQQVVLYKNAREAITNALRHGKATEIAVHLRYSEGDVVMEISNNGSVPKEGTRPLHSGGMGMKGMDERTRLIGGTLEIRMNPEFTLITRLPVYKPREIH